MRFRLDAVLATAITISVGFITLLGLLLTDGMGALSALAPVTNGIAGAFLQLVTITIALTLLIGVVNLLAVHLSRIVGRKKGAIYSVVLVLSFALVIGTYIIDRSTSMILLETVQISIESALAGLLFFALVFGASRMMRRRVTWPGVLFVAVLLIVLLGALPLGGLERVADARDWLLSVPVSAGARGLLLGIALATVVTGMRVLIGQDRSYRE
ncbi:MAG: hypothetical protein SF029_10460 [bacterium]|nr:hypothetical protein [bacterium]